MREASQPTPPSCVLFDFDGTMYSFEDVYTHVWRDLYEESRPAFGDIEYPAFYDRITGVYTGMPPGLGTEDEQNYVFSEMKRIWPGLVLPTERLIADHKRRAVEYMKPRDGFKELVVRLDSERIPWGIVSNHDSRNRHKLEAMKLPSQPATFMLSMEIGIWKPDKRIFEMALEEIGSVDCSTAVMVGDNPEADIGGGRSAGMRTVLMLDSPYAGNDDSIADLAITSFGELHRHWFGE